MGSVNCKTFQSTSTSDDNIGNYFNIRMSHSDLS